MTALDLVKETRMTEVLWIQKLDRTEDPEVLGRLLDAYREASMQIQPLTTYHDLYRNVLQKL